MRKGLLSSAFVACLILSCQSQPVIYRKGYIVSTKWDTTYGFIGAKNWEKCPDFILFSRDSTKTGSPIYPESLLGFGFTNGEHFATGSITFNDIAALVPPGTCCCSAESLPQYFLAYLRALVDGQTWSLYEYSSSVGERYAIRFGVDHSPYSFITLVGREINDDCLQPGSAVFKGQLFKEIRGTELQEQVLVSMIENSSYSRGSLTQVVSAMNIECPPTYVYNEEIHKDNSVFFSLGAVNTTVNFRGTNYYLGSVIFKSSYIPYFKFGYDFHNDWKSPSLTFRAAVASWEVNYQGSGGLINGGKLDYALRQITIQPSLALLWSIIYPGRRSEIYIGFGGGLNLSFYRGNNLETKYSGTTEGNPDYAGLSPYWFNLDILAGIFLGKRRWEISSFYQIAQPFVWDPTGYTYSLYPRTFGIAVTFHLPRKSD